MSTSDEKKAWDILLKNRLNPAHWAYAQMRSGGGLTIVHFKNKFTGDRLEILSQEVPVKKKRGRIE